MGIKIKINSEEIKRINKYYLLLHLIYVYFFIVKENSLMNDEIKCLKDDWFFLWAIRFFIAVLF
jgi:hypothetical protein